MTRVLRKRHRGITIALTILLPTLFVAALAARRMVPFNPEPQLDPAGGARTNLITR